MAKLKLWNFPLRNKNYMIRAKSQKSADRQAAAIAVKVIKVREVKQ